MDELYPERVRADIDLGALQHNFLVACRQRPDSHVLAVVKANAYGHGVDRVAPALFRVMRQGDAFAVATIGEGEQLRGLLPEANILVMQGAVNPEELQRALTGRFWLVLHSPYQLQLLQEAPLSAGTGLNVWLKLETGMNRLGMGFEDFEYCWRGLQDLPGVGRQVIMSHLASADDLGNDSVLRQQRRLQDMLQALAAEAGDWSISLAASGGVLSWPQTHHDWLRPGIMLYGGSSVLGETGPERGLRPVMTLRSRIVSIKTVAAGESIGYGATYTCSSQRCMGVVSVGYGDGYPRHAPNGTPVLVVGGDGPRRTEIIGRVSMDMITVALDDIDARIGDEVILWGQGLAADEIATASGTISYELFCKITSRVPFQYHGGDGDREKV